MKLTLGQDDALTEKSITTTLARVSADIRKEESERLLQSEAARLEAERQLTVQVAKTEQQTTKRDAIKQRIFWRCDKRAGREALVLSSAVWAVQAAIAVSGVVKISQSSKFGWALVTIGVLSGLVRLVGAHWEIKPIKLYPAYKEWRRARLQKSEYLALSIDDEP